MKIFSTAFIAALVGTAAASGFASFTLENQNPGKELVKVYSFEGKVDIPFGESSTFNFIAVGHDVVVSGKHLFYVELEQEGRLVVKSRESYHKSKYNVLLSLASESTEVYAA